MSLDGARPETNDAIRGRGTFARILAGVELLAERRFPDYSLNMVVTRLNFARSPISIAWPRTAPRPGFRGSGRPEAAATPGTTTG